MIIEEAVQLGLRAESPLDDLDVDLDLELLLLDRERVDEEFAAIMIASGFGDRIVVVAEPRHPAGALPTATLDRRGRREADRRHISSRVRSPPTRESIAGGRESSALPATPA